MRHPKHFDMRRLATKTECGTTMCIAGHTLDLAGYKKKYDADIKEFDWYSPDNQYISWPLEEAARLLGISNDEAGTTLYAGGLFFNYKLKTPEQAANAILKIIEQKEENNEV
jgi:hypothetical protein